MDFTVLPLSKNIRITSQRYSVWAISVLVFVLGEILKLLHPFVPFITEKIYKDMPLSDGPIMLASFPKYNAKRNYARNLKEIETIKEIIKSIRNIKVKVGAAPSKKVTLLVKTEHKNVIKNGSVYICKLAGVEKIEFLASDAIISEKVVSQVIEGAELFIPLGELVDMNQEIERLKKELSNVEKELARANGKLSNSGFVDKAPKALIDAEKAKVDKYLTIKEKLVAQINELQG